MMERLRRIPPFRVGLASLGALLLLAGLIYAISVAGFGMKDYTAYFTQSAGLTPKEDVQVAGVSSGQVKSVTLDGNRVKVHFTLKSSIHLGADSTADIRVATVLGTHLLAINPKGVGELAHDTIDVSHTTVPYNLQDVAEVAVPALGQYDAKKLSASLGVIADAFRGAPAETKNALDGVIRLSKVVNNRTAEVSALLASARNVTDRLTKNTGDIVDLMKQANLVLAELTSRRDTINAMLTSLNQLATDIAGTIKDTDGELTPMFNDLRATTQNLLQHKADLQQAITLLATTGRYVANATGEGPWIDLYLPVTSPDNVTCTANGGCG